MRKIKRILTGVLMAVVACIATAVFLPKETVMAATDASSPVTFRNALGPMSSSDTIKMWANFDISSPIEVYGNKTINGQGLSVKGYFNGYIFVVKYGATLTLNNVVIDSQHTGAGCVKGEVGSTIIINSGTYCNGNAANVHAEGSLYINGGNFTGSYMNGGEYCGYTSYSCRVTGGNFYGNTQTGFSSLLSEFQNGSYRQSVTITGGNYYSNGSMGLTVGAAATSMQQNPNYYGQTSVTITGGSFHNNTRAGIWIGADTSVDISNISSYSNKWGIVCSGNVNSSSNINVYSNTGEGIYVFDGSLRCRTYPALFNCSSGTIRSNLDGIDVIDTSSATLGKNVLISGNSNGAWIFGSLTSDAKIENGSTGVYVGKSGIIPGKFVMTGGYITGCSGYGINNFGKTTVTNGHVYSCNKSGYYGGDANHNGISFTVNGGSTGIDGYIYLAQDDKYVTTDSCTRTVNINPNSYKYGRVVIATNGSGYAASQKNSTLYPKTGWYLTNSGSNVILSDIYTVNFVNWNNSLISSNAYHYGANINVPGTPARPADATYEYTFAGWSPSISYQCYGNKTYTAYYNSKVIGTPPRIYYNTNMILSPLVLPGVDSWYNAETVNKVKTFTSDDKENDLVSF